MNECMNERCALMNGVMDWLMDGWMYVNGCRPLSLVSGTFDKVFGRVKVNEQRKYEGTAHYSSKGSMFARSYNDKISPARWIPHISFVFLGLDYSYSIQLLMSLRTPNGSRYLPYTDTHCSPATKLSESCFGGIWNWKRSLDKKKYVSKRARCIRAHTLYRDLLCIYTHSSSLYLLVSSHKSVQ